MRTGAVRKVNFSIQFFSNPWVTEKKTKISHTTNVITNRETNPISDADSCCLRGIKYLQATENSNTRYLVSLNSTRRRRIGQYFVRARRPGTVILFFVV